MIRLIIIPHLLFLVIAASGQSKAAGLLIPSDSSNPAVTVSAGLRLGLLTQCAMHFGATQLPDSKWTPVIAGGEITVCVWNRLVCGLGVELYSTRYRRDRTYPDILEKTDGQLVYMTVGGRIPLFTCSRTTIGPALDIGYLSGELRHRVDSIESASLRASTMALRAKGILMQPLGLGLSLQLEGGWSWANADGRRHDYFENFGGGNSPEPFRFDFTGPFAAMMLSISGPLRTR